MTVQDEEAHVETYLEEAPAASGIYRSTNTVGRVLKWNPSVSGSAPYWSLYYPDGTVNTFDRAGRLTQITYPDDPRKSLTLTYLATFNYSSPSAGISGDTAHVNEPFWRLARVTDGTGRYITFQYSANMYYWLTNIVASDGVTTLMSFSYANSDNVHRLTQTSQFGQTRTYIYNEAVNIATPSYVTTFWLTGILDELGQRFATYQYDDWGRAVASWHGTTTDNAEKVTLTYPSDPSGNPIDGQTIATLPLGDTRTYAYSASEPYRHPQSITTSVGRTTSYQYDDQNGGNSTYRKTRTTDSNGNITTYEYDVAGVHETARTEALGTAQQRRTETDWDAASNRVKAIRIYSDPAGGTRVLETQTAFQYDSNGRLQSKVITDPITSSARNWTYTYCQSVGATCPIVGLLQSVDGPRTDVSDVTTYSYYQSTDLSGCAALGGACHYSGDRYQVINALNQVTTFVSYDKNGHVTRTKDVSGVYMDYIYNSRGWLTQRILRADPSGNPSAGDEFYSFTYDNVGNLTKSTGPLGEYLSYTYDAAHRLTDVTDSLGNTIHYTLDAAGNRTKEDTKDPSSTLKRTLSRQYDQLNRLTKTLNATSVAVQTYQNPAEAPPTGVTYTNGYDGNGNAIYSVDSNGVGTEQQYDPLNRLVKTLQDHAGTGATKDSTTQYAYDTRDNLSTVTDPDGLVTTYTYNGLNNLTQLQSPDTGTTNYLYDAAGNRISQTDARGVTTGYQYDALNRLTKITFPTTSLNVTYEYDQAHPNSTCPTPASVGRLTGITDSTGSTTYCYGWHGNLRTKTQTINGVSYTTIYNFDNSHNLIGIVYPSGAILSYGQDAMRRVTSATYQANASAAATTLLSSISYYPFGPANVFTYGNGHTLTKSYDQNYAISQVASSLSSALTIVPTVDPMGNITNASNTVGGSSPTVTFQYDPLYRLTGMSPIVYYTYNGTGDRLTKTLQSGALTTYSYGPGTHHLTSDGTNSRGYDANGNTQSIGATAFAYDDRNRLATGAGTPYFYNGKGERVAKGSPQQQFVYDENGALLGEYGSTGTAVNEYLRIGDLVVGMSTGGNLYYVETDHLGTPRAAVLPGSTSANDALVWKWDFFSSAFGGAPPSLQTVTINLRYPGQYFDAETGLIHNGWRDYDKDAGRYAQSDPLGLAGDINTYSYVGGSPLNSTDPLGLCKVEARCNLLSGGPIFGKNFSHCYIVVTDPQGNQTYFRGGPSSDGNGFSATAHSGFLTRPGGDSGYGRIETESGKHTSGAIDWPTPDNPLTGSKTYINNSLPCTCISNQLDKAMRAINSAGINYNPLSTNSNSTAFLGLQSLGLDPGVAPAPAPGWGIPLPLNMGSSEQCCAQ